jgi:hypothetical protein
MNLTHLLHEVQTVAGVLIFLVSYFVFAWGKFPVTRIDRPAMAGQKGFRQSSRNRMNPLAQNFRFRWSIGYTF